MVPGEGDCNRTGTGRQRNYTLVFFTNTKRTWIIGGEVLKRRTLFYACRTKST